MKKIQTKKKTTRKKTQISINHHSVLNQMIDWAFACGEILNDHLVKSYERPLKVINKGRQGLATEADFLSEQFVMEEIKKNYPEHKILSEEDSFSRKIKIERAREDEFVWLIDPLDGTNNFYNRVPFFGVSLALAKGTTTLVGVVYNPVNYELFYAVRGEGAYLFRLIGDQEVRVRLKTTRKKKDFHEALLSANLSGQRVEKDLLQSFPEVRAMRRFGSAALEMSYVAAGMLDAYWEYNLRPWDMAASSLICEEAGVKISGTRGEKFNSFNSSVLTAHPTLYPSLLKILNKG